ncbi:hypothetical protein D3C87_1597420 [compost metagenome]
MNVEAVREHQRRAVFEVRFDFIFIYGCLSFIWHQNLHYIRTGYCFSYRQHFKAVILGGFERFAFAQADDNLKTAVTQVLCLGMPLAAVPDYCNCLPF